MNIHDRKAAILRASQGGLDYLLSSFDCEFHPVKNGKTQNKGKRKISLKLIDGTWYAKDWTESHPDGDIFAVCAAHHGLSTQGSDFIKVLEILESAYNIVHISGNGKRKYKAKPPSFPASKKSPDEPFYPNKGYEPKVSFTYQLDKTPLSP